MPIQFRCNHCNKRVQAPDSAGGKTGKCPVCGNVTEVPATTSPLPPPNATTGSKSGEVPDFVLPTRQPAGPIHPPQMQSAARYGIAAVLGIGAVIGIGYSIHYQMAWRERVNVAVEKAREDFQKLNEPARIKAIARIQEEHDAALAENQKTNENIIESIDVIQDRLDRGEYSPEEMEHVSTEINAMTLELEQAIDRVKPAPSVPKKMEHLDDAVKELNKKLDEALFRKSIGGDGPDPFVEAIEEFRQRALQGEYTDEEMAYLNIQLESTIMKKLNEAIQSHENKD